MTVSSTLISIDVTTTISLKFQNEEAATSYGHMEIVSTSTIQFLLEIIELIKQVEWHILADTLQELKAIKYFFTSNQPLYWKSNTAFYLLFARVFGEYIIRINFQLVNYKLFGHDWFGLESYRGMVWHTIDRTPLPNPICTRYVCYDLKHPLSASWNDAYQTCRFVNDMQNSFYMLIADYFHENNI